MTTKCYCRYVELDKGTLTVMFYEYQVEGISMGVYGEVHSAQPLKE